ncbi:MAG: 4'-phosphopantetheinyl transferase superfamily protein [Bryobacteraceae bacterium]|nr:4'-phosphopantetheinyl transferase superfamily protein [Bryobacteraceae bacterium]
MDRGWLDLASPAPLEAGEVHIWKAGLTTPPSALWRLLSADEGQRAERFHFERDRNRFVAARGILRILLGQYLGTPPERILFTYGARGKPFVERNADSLEFNVAHSEDLALYGFTLRREIGVDVEFLGRRIEPEEIARRFFAPDESAALLRLPHAERVRGFFHCWTRKEAFVKAKGEGIAFGLDQFSVSLAPGEPSRLLATRFDPAEAAAWNLVHLQPADGYVGAAAVRGEVRRLRLGQWQNG